MRIIRLAVFGLAAWAAVPVHAQAPAERWWAHLSFLASDEMNGRNTGTPEHRRAAEYVADQFKRSKLAPGGTEGYFQRVRFRSRRIVEERSSFELVRPDGAVDRVVLGDEATFSMRIEPAARVEAPIVFAGYGLQVPEVKHDDLAGLDLKGKIVMLLTGGPSRVSGPLLAHYQSIRWEYLKKAGAIGVFGIQNPKGQDVPWERATLARLMPQLSLVDTSLDETIGQQVSVTINPAKADKFLAGTGHTMQELLELSNDGKELPRFAVPSRARITLASQTSSVESDNVLGIVRGTDPALRNEYIVISAHLDHVGAGQPIAGDSIYNGAMDNASGIATLLETAAATAAAGGFKRSIIFAAVTAEEKGLLGSRYLANHPTVRAESIVANLNTDMFLPLFPLKSLIVQGLEESDLADDVKRAAAGMGIQVFGDPEPERRAFVRSDQYSFIKLGVPALSMKVGFVKDSLEHQIVRKWRTERYHAPSDDLNQPIDRQAAEDFGRVFLKVVEAVANRPTRPQWNSDSFFRRFARTAMQPGVTNTSAQTNPLWSEQKVKNFLPHMTWPEVRDLLRRTDMVLIPMPALEQHGLHGPIGIDYYAGIEQSKLIAQRTDILVAPILLVGQSPYHLEFPGTIALSSDTLQRVYFEAAKSLIDQGFRRIIFYSSHTGNQYVASFVADRINQETAAVAVTLADGVAAMRDAPRGGQSSRSQPVPFDRHGGVGETSLALYLIPTLVQLDKAERATLTLPSALSSLPPAVATGDRAATLVLLAEALKPKSTGKGTSTREMSTTGVWSERDPREATAEQGRQQSESFVDAAVRFIERWKQLRPR